MMLLLDIGNTRLKWAWFDGQQLGPQAAAAHTQWTVRDLQATLTGGGQVPSRMLVSNVGGAHIAQLLEQAAQAWGIQPEFVHSTAVLAGVRNAYPEPHKLGVDRWLSLIAAHALYPGQLACVVGVGTAVTIDTLDGGGQHGGGVIVPGPDLMVNSLLRHTSDIAARAAGGAANGGFFADNTRGAIVQGSAHALAALIERAVQRMQAQHGTPPQLLITGGAAETVTPHLGIPHAIIPDLVLRGLTVLAA